MCTTSTLDQIWSWTLYELFLISLAGVAVSGYRVHQFEKKRNQ